MSSEFNPSAERGFANADILILGGTAAGVALALSAQHHGAKVLLAGSRPYLGEDICGDFLFWAGLERAPECLFGLDLFGDKSGPVRPMTVKLKLEQALVEANIPFLLNAPPAQALRNDNGDVSGCVLATRSGMLKIAARLVVDASTEGTFSRISGETVTPLPSGRRMVRHTTLCHGAGSDADGIRVLDRPTGFKGRIGERAYELSARIYELDVDFGKGTLRDLARVEAEVSDRCWVPGEYMRQERLVLVPEQPVPPMTGTIESLPVGNGLCRLTPAAAGSPMHERILRDPVRAIDTGDHLGPWIAKQAMQRDKPDLRSLEAESCILNLDTCDVLVLGGGTGGAPAAIAAGRKGADTLVVESGDQLGGVGTLGQIARYWFGNRVGFTAEIDASVAALETDERLRKNIGQWSVSAKSHWYEHNCREAGVTMIYRSLCAGVETHRGRVTGLQVATPYGFGLIGAKCVVDATGAADVAAAAGAPTREITGEHIAVQGTGLSAMEPGEDYKNSDHNFCDDTDVFDATAFLVSSKLKFRDHFDAGQLVDSRERRQIVGDMELGPSDFLSERRYPDTICVASSNFDSHGFTVHPVFMCQPPHKKRLWADVPFRALLPKGLERVLVTGLGVSAHRDALPVIRMQADVQNQGYAAGYAAAVSALTDTDLRALDLRAIQQHLEEIEILPDRALTDEDTFPVGDAALHHACTDGIRDLKGLAIIFNEPERALPVLREQFASACGAEDRLHLALILALLGDGSGKEILHETVRQSEWDDGWNFTGMGQFGMSLSPLDVSLIALGKTGDAGSWPTILAKTESLPVDPEFSHCRAVVEACEALYPRYPDSMVAAALAALLRSDGISGHAQQTLEAAQNAVTEDPCQTLPRNRALRELHLARGLYRCGDNNGLGERVLQEYTRDLRSHFARHAQAVLQLS